MQITAMCPGVCPGVATATMRPSSLSARLCGKAPKGLSSRARGCGAKLAETEDASRPRMELERRLLDNALARAFPDSEDQASSAGPTGSVSAPGPDRVKASDPRRSGSSSPRNDLCAVASRWKSGVDRVKILRAREERNESRRRNDGRGGNDEAGVVAQG